MGIGRSARRSTSNARISPESGGFTLIELMIVVAVVAILAAIAYPSYQDQIRKSRRGQAKADMVELAQLAERFHTVNNTYAGFDGTLTAPQRVSPSVGPRVDYDLTVTGETQALFTITAAPRPPQNVDTCGTLTINQAGAKTPVDNRCW